MASLIAALKNPETGVTVKDRKYHLKTYRQCFLGKDVVSWLLSNGSSNFNLKNRDDAIALGHKLMAMQIFSSVNKGEFHSIQLF